jgi:hypothetical protein
MAAARKKKAALPDLTPEQRAFVAGKRWSRDSFGQVLVVSDGPVRGPIPDGISIAAPRINRVVRRHGHPDPGEKRRFIPDTDRPQGQPSLVSPTTERYSSAPPKPSGRPGRPVPRPRRPAPPPPPYYTIGRSV